MRRTPRWTRRASKKAQGTLGQRRIRAGLRRHGLVPRPTPIRSLFPIYEQRFTHGNAVQLYDDGRSGLAAMLEAITRATRRIHLETYILRGDSVGQRFMDALTERAAQGVEVRVLFDAVGSLGLPDSFFERLRTAGGEVVCFNPLRRMSRGFRPRRRDHRKILILDGQIGFTGGLNIGEEYDRGWGGEGWRDAHLRIEGPAVRDLEGLFLESWFRADGPDLPWHRLLEHSPERHGDTRCSVIPDGPAYRRRRTRDLLIHALDHAVHHVRLETPYFAPGKRVLEALSRASQRGISIDLVLAGRTDHPLLRRAAHAMLPRLLKAGIRVFEYESEMMHAKLSLFDEYWAIIGSSNLDRQSFEHSFEVNVLFEGGPIIEQVQQRFELDLGRSVPMDLDTLARRSITDRLLDRLASLLLFLM